MKKYFCDCCGKEYKNGRSNAIEIPVHITDTRLMDAYVDYDGNRVSGRGSSFDLCNRCLNEVYTAAYEVITNYEKS